LSAWALGKLKDQEARGQLETLLDDEGPVELYEHGDLRRTSVARLARNALAGLE
jgi:HEAT repeat protein